MVVVAAQVLSVNCQRYENKEPIHVYMVIYSYCSFWEQWYNTIAPQYSLWLLTWVCARLLFYVPPLCGHLAPSPFPSSSLLNSLSSILLPSFLALFWPVAHIKSYSWVQFIPFWIKLKSCYLRVNLNTSSFFYALPTPQLSYIKPVQPSLALFLSFLFYDIKLPKLVQPVWPSSHCISSVTVSFWQKPV